MEPLFVTACADGFLSGYETLLIKFNRILIKTAHVTVHFYDTIKLVQIAIQNGVAHNRRTPQQDFHRWDTASANSFQEALAHHPLKGVGDFLADKVTFILREITDHAVDGVHGGGGMKCAEHKVAGFRSAQSRADGLHVTHFAHQNDIGVFTKGAAQRIGEGMGVPAHLSLGMLFLSL